VANNEAARGLTSFGLGVLVLYALGASQLCLLASKATRRARLFGELRLTHRPTTAKLKLLKEIQFYVSAVATIAFSGH
jgi:hypothetical protein